LNPLPDKVELPTPRMKLALLAVWMLAFSAFAVFAMAHVSTAAWIGWVISLPAIAFALIFVLGIVNGVGVTLDREGFTVRSLWGEKRHLWANVSEFKIGHRGRARAIRFDDATRQDGMAKMRHSMGRTNAWISPLVVSGGLDKACALLNAFRARAATR